MGIVEADVVEPVFLRKFSHKKQIFFFVKINAKRRSVLCFFVVEIRCFLFFENSGILSKNRDFGAQNVFCENPGILKPKTFCFVFFV